MDERKLRAVAEDEKPPAKMSPRSVLEAVAGGGRRNELVAMRTRIARAIDEPNIRGADLAALSRRLMEISKEVEAIDVREHEDQNAATPTADDQWAAV